MKGLRKYLTPFAPDQSGAVAVFYELGGMIVICDAGGCAGNICGFDEPRWEKHKSAIFSAGLRDMDAIMGRDEKLAEKIAGAAQQIDVHFIALIGTPVPAVIGTDYTALSRLVEKRTHLPVVSVDTNGMELYDRGERKAYDALYRKFAKERFPVKKGKVNVFGEALGFAGAEPAAGEGDPSAASESGDDPLEKIRRASEAEKNIAASPSGIAAARYLQETFGTPYEIFDPAALRILPRENFSGQRILIVHQHVTADTLRRELLQRGAADVTAATWFSFARQIRQETDVFLKEEDDFTQLVSEGGYDLIIADEAMKPLAPDFQGRWIDAPHFALSGRRA